MVFDKTGTLTRGQLAVVAAVPARCSGLDPAGLLRLAAAVEQFSEHPLALAIVQASPGALPIASEFVSLRGSGASARVEAGSAQRVSVGSARLVDPSRAPDLLATASQHAAQGETVVWVGREREITGFIALRDQLNTTARGAIG